MTSFREKANFMNVSSSARGLCWRLRSEDDRLALAITQRLDQPEIIGRILAGRGVGLEQAEAFLKPSLRNDLPDPSVLKDLDKASERIAEAVMEGQGIGIFGDYDVDGATSGAVLIRFLNALGVEPLIHIPDRVKEGYGPNGPALEALADQGAWVVITVDCGITAHDALTVARDAGLEVIVADHHQAGPDLPPAYAVINPNRLDDTSGLGYLAAVGVTFLLVIGINRALRARNFYADRGIEEPDLLQWLDLVALGTVCDVVPLTGLNRTLVSQGLRVMARRGNEGITALSDVARLDETPGAYHAGFILGPRVNAGGRVGRSDLGVRLLSTRDAEVAGAISVELDNYNEDRKTIEDAVLSAVLSDADHMPQADLESQSVLMFAGQGWHQGVIGIVSSRIKDRYGKPNFIISVDRGIGKGSGRSIPGVDIGAAVIAASQAGLLIAGGGHAMAAGLTVAEEKIEELRHFFNDRLAKFVAQSLATASLGIDGALSAGACDRSLLATLDQLGPWGAGHAEPRFVLPNVEIQYPQVAGDNHVRLTLRSGDGKSVKAIAFRAMDSDLGPMLLNAAGGKLHIAGHLRADNWQGRRNVQFIVEDAAK